MSETSQIILCIFILIIIYALTRRVHAWRMARAYTSIIKDLEEKGAVDPSSAVALPYAKKSIFRFGTRDYRPKAVEYMLFNNIIGIADSGKYYLKDKKVDPLNSNYESTNVD